MGLGNEERSSGLVLDRDGAVLVYNCVSHVGLGCRTHELVPGHPVTLHEIY